MHLLCSIALVFVRELKLHQFVLSSLLLRRPKCPLLKVPEHRQDFSVCVECSSGDECI